MVSGRSGKHFRLIVVISTAIFIIYLFKNTNTSSFENDYSDNINVTIQSLQGLAQDDPKIVEYILKHHIYPPSTLPYNLETKESDTIHQYTDLVLKILGNKTNGVFAEAGAFDGEYGSPTLYLERFYGWTGLLAEPSKVQLPKLLGKGRKSWIADVCLSPNEQPGILEYLQRDDYKIANKLGSMKDIPENEKHKWNTTTIPCFPLYSILSAVNMKNIDYFSLDVEGVELQVLKTIPFDLVSIKIFSIEHHLVSAEVKNQMKSFLKSKGYKFVKAVHVDYIFAHESVYSEDMKL